MALRDKAANSSPTSPALQGGSSGAPQARTIRSTLVGNKYIGFTIPILSVVGLIVIWELVVLIAGMRPYILPTPIEVGQSMVQYRSVLLQAIGVTSYEVALGFAVAVVIAVPSAIGIAYSTVLDRLLSPLLVGSQAVPKVAIAPLFLLWFGFGELPKILIAALVAFFPIVINGVIGLRSVDPDLIRMARVTRASPLKVFWKIRVPMAMPSLFGGFKLGITFSVIGAVVAEFVAGTSGLGYVVQLAQGNEQTALAFCGLVILTLMALVLYYIVEGIERWVVRG